MKTNTFGESTMVGHQGLKELQMWHHFIYSNYIKYDLSFWRDLNGLLFRIAIQPQSIDIILGKFFSAQKINLLWYSSINFKIK